MKLLKEFFKLWGIILGTFVGILAVIGIVVGLAALAYKIHPVFGPVVVIMLFVTGLIAFIETVE